MARFFFLYCVLILAAVGGGLTYYSRTLRTVDPVTTASTSPAHESGAPAQAEGITPAHQLEAPGQAEVRPSFQMPIDTIALAQPAKSALPARSAPTTTGTVAPKADLPIRPNVKEPFVEKVGKRTQARPELRSVATAKVPKDARNRTKSQQR